MRPSMLEGNQAVDHSWMVTSSLGASGSGVVVTMTVSDSPSTIRVTSTSTSTVSGVGAGPQALSSMARTASAAMGTKSLLLDIGFSSS
jgi:hypothetical protein